MRSLFQPLCWLLGLAILLTGACSKSDNSLTVYSGRSDKFIKPIIAEFEKKTGIKVKLHTAKSTALLNKLRLEGEKTPADLFISNDAGNLQIGSEMGLFQAIPNNIADLVPAKFRANDNTWIGLSGRARVLVVNKSSDADAKSIWDLADPKYKGKLAITHSSNESFIAGVTIYMQAKGKDAVKEWLTALKDNADGVQFNKHSKIVKAVADGKKDIGLVNHYYIFRHLAKDPQANIRILLPDQGESDMGIAWNVAGIAVSKHSKKSAAAIKLVEYLVSDQGQSQFAMANREYPTRANLNIASEIPKQSDIKVAEVPLLEIGKQRSATLDIIDEVGLP